MNGRASTLTGSVSFFRGRPLFSFALAFGLLATDGKLPGQVTASTSPVADSFTRSAQPNSNFGNMGALSVSGLIATNGLGSQQGAYDSFLRFDVSSLASTFNTSFGAGNWTISGANLKLTEVAAPNNSIFNRGVGQFEVRWIGNDTWTETGITWNNESNALNSGQASLGTFSNAGTDGLETFSLALPASFVNDVLAGGSVSLYMTPTANSTVGFTFNARNFGTESARPFLELTAVPEPSTMWLLAFSVAVPTLVRHRRSH
jgi:hypothetical protein